ncbi:MAG: hypothetical protein KGI25_00410 [Thaumarchaeota archaeon]|nr:hypothetical protein [Nitrososphaerota archaeon]
MKLKEFVEKYGGPYSKMLGIDLKKGNDDEICKWLLAAILYSKPIRESSATRTYQCFEKDDVLTPKEIIETGWDGLVSILDEGGYTRYDFSTANRLLGIFGNLQKNYEGKLSKLYDLASDGKDLETRLRSLGKGVGDTTVSIFLRDMREIWPKASPTPSPLVKMAMKEIGIKNLDETARKERVSVISLETALMRLAKDFIKKGKVIKITA